MSQVETDTVRIIAEAIEAEPEPIWPTAPRFCSSRSFPDYRYVRGVNPHPTNDKKGHSYGISVKLPEVSRTDWHKHRDFLFAIDLYHQGYLWESHRTWREIAATTGEDCLETSLLQALIANSAAQIRAHRLDAGGARTYSQSARWHAARMRSVGHDGKTNRFMGFDIADLIERIDRHYTPLWEQEHDESVLLMGTPPLLLPRRSKHD